ncbi:MAG: hypothetical protein H8E13_09450 [Actinobacteria bacterium]|nr:hypothetical protein [Actinomycetota bacterium]
MAVKPARIALAYCAGLIDGEGCISIGKRYEIKHNNLGNNQFKKGKKARKDTWSPNYSLFVIVVQKDKCITDWLYGNFGGSLDKAKGSGFSTQTKYHRWVLRSNDALKLLKRIKPYLILKKDQALIGIELQKHLKGSMGKRLTEEKIQKREKLYQQLKAIKRNAVATTKPNPDLKKI